MIIDRLTSRAWWKMAASRAIWTFIEVILCVSPGVGVLIENIDFKAVGGVLLTALFGAFLALLKSLVAGIPEYDEDEALYFDDDADEADGDAVTELTEAEVEEFDKEA